MNYGYLTNELLALPIITDIRKHIKENRKRNITWKEDGMYRKYAELRDQRGMTDLQVAKATGIPQSTIYDWRHRSAKDEDASISIKYLSKIAKCLKVKIDRLV